RQWAGLVIGFVGVGLVVQGGSGVTWSQLGGDLLALGAAGAWAWYGLVIGPLVGALGPVRATGWTMVVAALTIQEGSCIPNPCASCTSPIPISSPNQAPRSTGSIHSPPSRACSL